MNASSSLTAAPTLAQNRSGGIPRRLIQTGKSSDLPLVGRAAVANIKLLNPDFEYCFFDNAQVAEFMAEEPPEYQEVFHGFPYPIERYDFFRYLAVYRLGGFYLDLDVFLAQGLAPLLNCACVFPFEELTLSGWLRRQHQIDWEIGNYAFGAEAGHPFLKAVIENCVKAHQNPGWAREMIRDIPRPFRSQFVVTNTTGPGLVTRTLAEQPALRKTVSILFPEDVCDAQTWHRFGNYGVHLMQASWRKQDGFLRRRLANFWEARRREHWLREKPGIGPRTRG